MAADDGDGIFVYLGGEQEVPSGVTHAIIDPSVKTVRRRAFSYRRQLVSVIFHDGVEIIENESFHECESLSGRIKLLGVRGIGERAFRNCFNLSDVEFGDKLKTIGDAAFYRCSLTSIKISSVRSTKHLAFGYCYQLTEVEFGSDLETIGWHSFHECLRLQRIAIPLKDKLFPFDKYDRRYNQFFNCRNLTTVDIVGDEGVRNTISSLLIESWRDEMNEEIDRINRELPDISMTEKAKFIRRWVRSVINRIEHYKAEHNRLLKEHMTQLELAVWKAKLDEKDDDSAQWVQTKRANKVDEKSTRGEKRITSGADNIIIKNVLPFLKLA